MTGMPYKENHPPSSTLHNTLNPHTHMCNAATILSSANRVGDSFRIVNYAIMLDLGRILSHCTLLHIICHSAPCPTHIIIPLRMASILCRFFQLNKNTLKRTGVDGQHIFQISSTVTITRCAHWLVCKVDQSTRVNELAARERGIQVEN